MGKVRHDSGSDEDTEKTFTKGPWTQAEDNLLVAYVDQHGDGNWNAVQKHSGLCRCGKSCRLRWVNHLRPDLKKGAFTEKEEKRVIELHALLGNKWARMAGELPGRTDNEIKNFWNTRLKRLQRLGLPVYPDDVREQAMNLAAQSGLNIDSLDGHNSQDSFEADTVEIPEVDFKHLPLSQSSTYYQVMLQSVPTSGGFMRQRQGFFQPNMYNVISSSPYMANHKIFKEQEAAVPFASGGYEMNEQSPLLWNYPFVESSQEPLPDSYFFYDHATTYSSPSEPLIHEVEKVELPSFQCFDSHEDPGGWEAQQFNTMPELESDNTLVQSPLTNQTPSSLYDGLLESVVYGSRQETNIDSESSLLGHMEITPASENNTRGQNFSFETNLDYFGSTSSDERLKSFDGDWIKELLGEDTYSTK